MNAKRSLSLLLGLALLSCAGTVMAAPAKPITLRLWGGVQPEYGYDDMVQNFNQEFKSKGIQMEYVRWTPT